MANEVAPPNPLKEVKKVGVFLLAILLLSVAVAIAILSRATLASMETSSLSDHRSRMKTLAHAVLLYAEANEGVMPEADEWHLGLLAYGAHSRDFLSRRPKENIAFFRGAGGRTLASAPNPASLPLIFDSNLPRPQMAGGRSDASKAQGAAIVNWEGQVVPSAELLDWSEAASQP